MTRANRITEEELIEDLKKTAEKVSQPLSQKQYREHGRHSSQTLINRFGTFNKAKDAAGLEKNIRGKTKKFEDEEAKELLNQGLTSKEAAKRLGVSQSHFSKRLRNSAYKVLNQFTQTNDKNSFIISFTSSDLREAGFDPEDGKIFFDKEVKDGEIVVKLKRNRVAEIEGDQK